jgi:hypothetical protein
MLPRRQSAAAALLESTINLMLPWRQSAAAEPRAAPGNS